MVPRGTGTSDLAPVVVSTTGSGFFYSEETTSGPNSAIPSDSRDAGPVPGRHWLRYPGDSGSGARATLHRPFRTKWKICNAGRRE